MPGSAHAGTGPAGSAELEARIRAEVAPTAELLARVARARDALVELATAKAKAKGIPLVRAIVAGSAARATFLSDRLDIDLFLLFDPKLSREDLERDGLALAGELFERSETRYAEHPYLRGEFAGFHVDAVPGYAVEDPSRPLSAVDRTPYHNEYLRERQTPAMVEEIRLAKRFLRAQGVYGSEARTQGLSGYLVELLILKFGSLDGLLGAAREWRAPVRVAFTAGAEPRVPPEVPLILDDPVDPNRNVASALSRRNFATLVLAAQAYLERPRDDFFEIRSPARVDLGAGVELARERGSHIAVLTLLRPALVDDILFPQIAKAARSIAEEAERTGFRVLGTAFAASDRTFSVLVETAEAEVPAVRRQDGPPPGIARAEPFLEKWTAEGAPVLQGPFVAEDGRLAVESRRSDRGVEAILTSRLRQISLGRDLAKSLPADAGFYPLSVTAAAPELPLALGELLAKRLPWLTDPAPR
ncbi:MAG TPA: CCA tRNA nucleotidyltransferase [Thermoplasmata archaeon]|nr:CCA tRNA nucleotidyltransferase [Thermoplasmata archaeon]